MKDYIKIILSLMLASCGKTTPQLTAMESNKVNNDSISGSYNIISFQNEVIPSCNLHIDIVKSGKEYKYYLTSNQRNVKGQVKIFQENSTPKELVLEFIGLQYDSYDERYNDRPNVGGILLNDTLTIQVYGNSMNEYVKLGECEPKYITLVKQ
ncbi:hypothetical protein [Flavobacterium suzhouense]|uniref:Lipoprotein n=1 Tax=Flavobacterium suzhouense TaxID=1529638 RepID=A0ABW5NXK8_9FLAO